MSDPRLGKVSVHIHGGATRRCGYCTMPLDCNRGTLTKHMDPEHGWGTPVPARYMPWMHMQCSNVECTFAIYYGVLRGIHRGIVKRTWKTNKKLENLRRVYDANYNSWQTWFVETFGQEAFDDLMNRNK